MKYTYEELENVIVRTDENGNISNVPKDPGNSDYQAYLNPNKVEHLTEIPTN